MVGRQYIYDDDSYQTLADAEIGWLEADQALHSQGPQIVRHVGSDGLNIAARVPGDGWLVLGFVEVGDEMWLLTAARRLGDDESAALDRMFGGQP